MILPSALVGNSANLSARAAVTSDSFSAGTTLFTSPIRNASPASTASPSMLISMARPSPTTRGNKNETPASGIRPIFMNATENLPFSAAIRRSHASAMPTPAP